jgi:hypothetical protein
MPAVAASPAVTPSAAMIGGAQLEASAAEPAGQGLPIMGPFIIQLSQSPMCWSIQSII